VRFVLNNAAGGGKDIKTALWLMRMRGLLYGWLAVRASEPSLALTRDVDAREAESIKKKLSAANLSKLKSLASPRSAISGVPNARELGLHKLAFCHGAGDKISFRWFLKVVDKAGVTTVKIYDMSGIKVDGGFRIGEK